MTEGDGGDFGDWERDEEDLACFDLRGSAVREDVWHQVGNDRITATAHADGSVTLYAWEEGLVRLSLPVPLAAPAELCTRFGFGYAQWERDAGNLRIVRRVWAPFGETAGLRVDVSLEGELPPAFTERWSFAPFPLLVGGLMSRRIAAPRTATLRERALWDAMLAASSVSRAATDAVRRALGWRLRLRPRVDPALGAVLLEPATSSRGPSRRSLLPRVPGVVFVAALGERGAILRAATRGRRTDIEAEVALARGSRQARLSFAVGFSKHGDVPTALDALRAASPNESARRWQGVWRLDLPSAPALARETSWHALYLRSAQVRDTVLGCRYLPQGSAYSYVHGLQGAPRDYAIASLPLSLIDPAGARDLLRLCLRLVRRDGSLHYAHTGAGVPTSAGIHAAPSDLPLFLLWAVTDYVWSARDREFLDEARPALLRAWRHLRDGVGLGPHGLLRAGSGDWNDPITAFAPSRRAFHRRGESSFNSALAVYVLPRAAELLPEEGAAMRSLAEGVREAMRGAWTGRWFLRGYDGAGGELGREHLFLDANALCLVARLGSDAQRRTLADAIVSRCCDPSPIGPTILDRPHPVRAGLLPAGWDTNGGVWAFVSAITVWGLALHDPERAWRCLEKQTLAAHARAYPHVWYGIWSAPDAYNAHFGERPGETYVQPATPMREFPVMNSNAHAGPLLALLKALGVEATPEGVAVHRPPPRAAGAWRITTPLARLAGSADANAG